MVKEKLELRISELMRKLKALQLESKNSIDPSDNNKKIADVKRALDFNIEILSKLEGEKIVYH